MVLDNGGVPIEIGDVVYGVFSGIAYKVDGFGEDGKPCTTSEFGIARAVEPELVTHERPDTWEQIERDADKVPCGYFGFNDKRCTEGCPAFNSGKTCIAAACADLVRRAKALAEKGVE